MPQLITAGSLTQCSFGSAPCALLVLPAKMVNAGAPAATIMDFAPVVNLPTFGTCSAPTNPAVIAAGGSPVPCVPVTTAPWVPGSTKVMIKGLPALTSTCKCLCSYLGVIQVTTPAQMTVMAN